MRYLKYLSLNALQVDVPKLCPKRGLVPLHGESEFADLVICPTRVHERVPTSVPPVGDFGWLENVGQNPDGKARALGRVQSGPLTKLLPASPWAENPHRGFRSHDEQVLVAGHE